MKRIAVRIGGFVVKPSFWIETLMSRKVTLEVEISQVNLPLSHGLFNNSVSTTSQCRRHLDKLFSLFDLDLINLCTNLDGQLNNNNYDHSRCRYLSPHSFKLFNRKLSNSEVQSSFSQ